MEESVIDSRERIELLQSAVDVLFTNEQNEDKKIRDLVKEKVLKEVEKLK